MATSVMFDKMHVQEGNTDINYYQVYINLLYYLLLYPVATVSVYDATFIGFINGI